MARTRRLVIRLHLDNINPTTFPLTLASLHIYLPNQIGITRNMIPEARIGKAKTRDHHRDGGFRTITSRNSGGLFKTRERELATG